MSLLPGTLVSTEWLENHLLEPSVHVVDIRGYVKTVDAGTGDGKQISTYMGAKDEYDDAHIPGAVFIDWTSDITDPDDPVPVQIASPERFKAAMGMRGIGDETDVVVVDHTGGHFATRLWWALNYYGHSAVAVLDGGMAKWLGEERPVTDEVLPHFPTSASLPMQTIPRGMRPTRSCLPSPTRASTDHGCPRCQSIFRRGLPRRTARAHSRKNCHQSLCQVSSSMRTEPGSQTMSCARLTSQPLASLVMKRSSPIAKVA